MSTTSHTPRNGRPADDSLVLDTRSLGRTPGAVSQVTRAERLAEAIGVELIRLPAGSEVSLDLLLTCVEEGVLVTGHVSGVASVECARCLGEFTAPVEVELTEMYAYPGAAAADAAESDDVRLLDGDLLDLEPALVDAFGLDFPLAPTCTDYGREECVDPATPRPDGVSGEEGGRIDPRWAGLAEKFGMGDTAGEDRG
ncbi:YceD family protein [Dietzia sp. 179-F 9C3 NHS]|uniref:YceD family protein n=1 Tax=Dietzia sp. 179-F 9C3 NHS TaxID=3374295 RepID=UPI0038791B34